MTIHTFTTVLGRVVLRSDRDDLLRDAVLDMLYKFADSPFNAAADSYMKNGTMLLHLPCFANEDEYRRVLADLLTLGLVETDVSSAGIRISMAGIRYVLKVKR
jgi:hypothetical protein